MFAKEPGATGNEERFLRSRLDMKEALERASPCRRFVAHMTTTCIMPPASQDGYAGRCSMEPA